MTEYQLTLTARKRPETLERVLRVIRHRGFEVLTLAAKNTNEQLHIQLVLHSDREIALLVNQLAKLPDVLHIV